MTEQDIQAWEREINHAQMMWRLAYKHEVNKRNEQMAWSEAQANQAMASAVEQNKRDDIKAKNISYDFALSEEKKRKNSEFWHRIMHIVAVAIILVTILRFWG
ncbi:hypothetical protein [Psychrobacter sp.]|uniref:hypothetical protein n=1 Tax=Psychrobacter sp. TaxID=56811 RepID=UPI00356AE44D